MAADGGVVAAGGLEGEGVEQGPAGCPVVELGRRRPPHRRRWPGRWGAPSASALGLGLARRPAATMARRVVVQGVEGVGVRAVADRLQRDAALRQGAGLVRAEHLDTPEGLDGTGVPHQRRRAPTTGGRPTAGDGGQHGEPLGNGRHRQADPGRRGCVAGLATHQPRTDHPEPAQRGERQGDGAEARRPRVDAARCGAGRASPMSAKASVPRPVATTTAVPEPATTVVPS